MEKANRNIQYCQIISLLKKDILNVMMNFFNLFLSNSLNNMLCKGHQINLNTVEMFRKMLILMFCIISIRNFDIKWKLFLRVTRFMDRKLAPIKLKIDPIRLDMLRIIFKDSREVLRSQKNKDQKMWHIIIRKDRSLWVTLQCPNQQFTLKKTTSGTVVEVEVTKSKVQQNQRSRNILEKRNHLLNPSIKRMNGRHLQKNVCIPSNTTQ